MRLSHDGPNRPSCEMENRRIASLKMARGTQNKILGSMALGLPVVATPQAAKGIQAVPGQHLLLANLADDFGRKTVEVLLNAELRMNLSAAAQKQLQGTHRWAASMKILDAPLRVDIRGDL